MSGWKRFLLKPNKIHPPAAIWEVWLAVCRLPSPPLAGGVIGRTKQSTKKQQTNKAKGRLYFVPPSLISPPLSGHIHLPRGPAPLFSGTDGCHWGLFSWRMPSFCSPGERTIQPEGVLSPPFPSRPLTTTPTIRGIKPLLSDEAGDDGFNYVQAGWMRQAQPQDCPRTDRSHSTQHNSGRRVDGRAGKGE